MLSGAFWRCPAHSQIMGRISIWIFQNNLRKWGEYISWEYSEQYSHHALRMFSANSWPYSPIIWKKTFWEYIGADSTPHIENGQGILWKRAAPYAEMNWEYVDQYSSHALRIFFRNTPDNVRPIFWEWYENTLTNSRPIFWKHSENILGKIRPRFWEWYENTRNKYRSTF